VFFNVEVLKSGARTSSALFTDSNSNVRLLSAPVVIVNLSEYARVDFSTPKVYDMAWGANNEPNPYLEFYSTPVGVHRAQLLKDMNRVISAERSESSGPFARFGNSVTVNFTEVQVSALLLTELVFSIAPHTPPRGTNTGSKSMRGAVGSTWRYLNDGLGPQDTWAPPNSFSTMNEKCL